MGDFLALKIEAMCLWEHGILRFQGGGSISFSWSSQSKSIGAVEMIKQVCSFGVLKHVLQICTKGSDSIEDVS